MSDTKTKQVIALLKQLGISRVEISFDGGGDSGQVGEITFESVLHPDPDFLRKTPCPEHIDWAEAPKYQWDDVLKKNMPVTRAPSVDDMLDTYAYHALDVALDFDWVNNEGGFGTIIIRPAEGVVHIDADERVTTTENHHYDLGETLLEEVEDTPLGNEEAA
jgi:hypothetical protein